MKLIRAGAKPASGVSLSAAAALARIYSTIKLR